MCTNSHEEWQPIKFTLVYYFLCRKDASTPAYMGQHRSHSSNNTLKFPISDAISSGTYSSFLKNKKVGDALWHRVANHCLWHQYPLPECWFKSCLLHLWSNYLKMNKHMGFCHWHERPRQNSRIPESVLGSGPAQAVASIWGVNRRHSSFHARKINSTFL